MFIGMVEAASSRFKGETKACSATEEVRANNAQYLHPRDKFLLSSSLKSVVFVI